MNDFATADAAFPVGEVGMIGGGVVAEVDGVVA
jgi:hypothetical protein